MTQTDTAAIMLLLGALHDSTEKLCGELPSKAQLVDIRLKMEKIICKPKERITIASALRAGFKKDDFYYGEGDGATEGKTCWFYNIKFPAGEYEVDGLDLKFYDDEFHGLYYGQTLLPHIKWIHQVKDLYFILTNQELVLC